jgi:hypothetical protein
MAEWQADRTVQVKGPSRQHSVYFWVIPADVDGTWRISLTAPTGAQQYVLRLHQQFQEVRGSMRAEGNEIPISNATLTGDRLRFTVITGEQLKMSFDGRVDTNAMRGRVEVQGKAMAGRYTWTSQREAAGATTAPQR